jgi:alkylhydroperoxidase family enzyme
LEGIEKVLAACKISPIYFPDRYWLASTPLRGIKQIGQGGAVTRIPLVENKESLAREHQGVYEAIVKSRGEVRGCFPALLYVPTIADHSARLGGYLRFAGKLDSKVRTLAAMTAARELDCIHEWATGVKR